MDQVAVLERVVAWARHDDNIRVLVLTGSVARGDGAFDELSDLDIELYVTDPSELLEHEAWYRRFGEVLVVEALENPGWNPTRLVYYADGKLDFMVAATGVLQDGVSYDRPFQLLIDKDDVGGAFRRSPREQQPPPTAAEFLRCVHWFYAAAIMWARCLVRDEPWAAKTRDWDSKSHLLTMLEWDHKARKGWDYDTWYNGTHLYTWMDPDLVKTLEACWSGLSLHDSTRALQESLALFDALSTRTAIALEIEPFDATRVRQRVQNLLGATL
jgi:aminoglycoside 6-adenylyltransferase